MNDAIAVLNAGSSSFKFSLFAQGDGYIRYFVTRDANFDSLKFDVLHPGRYQRQVVALSQTIGSLERQLGVRRAVVCGDRRRVASARHARSTRYRARPGRRIASGLRAALPEPP